MKEEWMVVKNYPVYEVSTLGRATQGVRLIKLKDDQKVATVSLVVKDEDMDEELSDSQETVENVESTESVEENNEGQTE